jgi:CBS domain-containing protein
MAADRVHRLLVIDGSNLVGIISSMDVLRALTLWQADRAA